MSSLFILNRLTLRQLILAVAALSLGNSAALAADQETVAPRPNIVLIVADDLAPQLCTFTAQGQGRGLTPHLDALAAEGVVLANMHSPSPICTPSRFAILTGQYPSRATNPGFLQETQTHGGQTSVAFNTHLSPDETNLPKRLQAAGYTTGIVGKNHVVDVPGFERLPYRSKLSDPHVQATLATNAKYLKAAFHDAGFDFAESLYWGNPDADGIRELAAHNQEWITAAARRFIAESSEDDQPFFLYMATTIPHGPHEDERSWRADPRITPEGLLEDLPAAQAARDTIATRLEEAKVKGWNRANVLWLDDAVGALVEELQARGVKENTILVFLSDHGTEAKGSVYRRGTQTVSLIWRDGGFAVGDVAEQAFMLPDLAPTILNWAQADFSADAFDGLDMSATLNGEQDELHDSLYFEVGFTRAVQRDGMKYIAVRYPLWATELSVEQRQRKLDRLIESLEQRGRPVPTRDPMTPYSHLTVIPGGADAEQVSIGKHPAYFEADQLYDLRADPNEQNNLADDPAYADTLAGLKALLDERVRSLPGDFAEFGQSPVVTGR